MEPGLRAWVESLPDWEREGPASAQSAARSSSAQGFSPAPTRACLAALGCLGRLPLVLHVVGSKGKGAVSTMAAAILRAHGLRVGLYQSPHMFAREERIVWDGACITPAAYATYLARIRDSGAAADCSRFEVETAAAIAFFVDNDAQAIVLEAGLGGVQDATHAVVAEVVALTSVELEHRAVLGETLGAIAAQKAGVLPQGGTLVTGPLPEAAEATVAALVTQRAATRLRLGEALVLEDAHAHVGGQRFHFAWHWPERGETLEPIELPLLGQHQVAMAGIASLSARAFLEAAGVSWSAAAARDALGKVSLLGRLQSVTKPPEPPILVDVAHTPASVAAACAACQAHFGTPPQVVMLALNRDKRVPEIGAALGASATTLLLVPNPGPRGAPPSEMLAQLDTSLFAEVEVLGSWEAGWARLHMCVERGPALVLGSFRLVGALLQHLGWG